MPMSAVAANAFAASDDSGAFRRINKPRPGVLGQPTMGGSHAGKRGFHPPYACTNRMGTGHGPRMNDVRQAFMHARIAGVLEGAETIRQYREGAAVERPDWGDMSRMMGAAPEDEPVDMSVSAVVDRAAALLAANRARRG